MYKKLYLLLVAVLATVSISNAQSTDANITGHVVDAATGEHMPHVTIAIQNTNYGTVTDATGHFFMKNLPAGEHTFEASFMGYSPVRTTINVKANNTMTMNFSLKEDVLAMDQIVVSASRSNVSRLEAPTIVTVLSGRVFESVGATNLAEGLTFQPGVRVEDNCQNCGFTQVRINGLDGHYSQVLLDSRAVYSALTGVYGLEQIPANMIDRIEVVRGGGSALFGSSAIGGTINIITKEPTYNSAELASTISVIGGSATDHNTTFNASLVSDNQRAGVMLYGQMRDRESYDDNGDGFSEIPTIQSLTLGMRSFLKTSERSKLTFQYHGTNEFRRGGDNLDLPAHYEEVETAEQVEHNINGGDLSYEIFSRNYNRRLNVYTSFQSTERDSYYGGGGLDAYGHTSDLVYVAGAQFTNKWDNLWFMPAEFVAGVEYNYNDLVDEYFAYPEYLVDQKINVIGTYLQNEWRNEKFGFLVGARIDSHSLIDNPVISPRLNVRYNPSEKLNFRASYSTGFRAPQAFDEDLHIAMVGGEQTSIVLSDDLKQESSVSYSLSADMYQNFGKVRTNLLVEGFYTRLTDVFALRDSEDSSFTGGEQLERYNASGATVKGVNLEARAVISEDIQLQAGATIQDSKYDEAEEWSDDAEAEIRMFRTPNVYGYLTANFTPIKPLEISISGTYTGSMLAQHCAGSGTDVDVAVETPSFVDMNLKVSYDFKVLDIVTLQVNAGVQNIFNSYQSDFDEGADRDSGYIYGPSAPRSVFAGIKMSF